MFCTLKNKLTCNGFVYKHTIMFITWESLGVHLSVNNKILDLKTLNFHIPCEFSTCIINLLTI